MTIKKGWAVKEVLITEGIPGTDPRRLCSCCQLVLLGYFTLSIEMLTITHLCSELYSKNCPSCSWNSNLQACQSIVSFLRPSSPKFVLQLQLAVSPPKELSRVVSTFMPQHPPVLYLQHPHLSASVQCYRKHGWESIWREIYVEMLYQPWVSSMLSVLHVWRGKSASR